MSTVGSRSSSSSSVADLVVDTDDEQLHQGTKPFIAAARQLTIDEICRLTRFSRHEVRALYRTLKQECPRGVVGEDTLRDVYARLFPEGNGSLYARHVFRTLDPKNSGAVTFPQLLMFLSTIYKGSAQDRLRWVFRLYDLDGDGVIQLSELFNLIWAVREMSGLDKRSRPSASKADDVDERDKEKRKVKQQAEKLFHRWDLNRDGLVTWDEFLTSCLHDEAITRSLNYFDALY